MLLQYLICVYELYKHVWQFTTIRQEHQKFWISNFQRLFTHKHVKSKRFAELFHSLNDVYGRFGMWWNEKEIESINCDVHRVIQCACACARECTATHLVVNLTIILSLCYWRILKSLGKLNQIFYTNHESCLHLARSITTSDFRCSINLRVSLFNL